MKISFVGKGGSGKSTLSAAFSSYLKENTEKNVLVFDADLNIHIPELLGFKEMSIEKHLSDQFATLSIKVWLIGENKMENLAAFRKSTPPTRLSNILKVEDVKNTPLFDYCLDNKNLFLFTVGTYQEQNIGASCYHSNLAILENILSHTDDKNGYIVVDMVAGTDSFAGTLHSQFDINCLVVEPTRRSIEVFNDYFSLAKTAGTSGEVFVIGNKIRNEKDKQFIEENIPKEKILGYFEDDDYIREIDQTGSSLEADLLNDNNKKLLEKIKEKLDSLPDSRNKRLERLWKLHEKYVSQSSIKIIFGDLTNQIDKEFSFK